MNHLTSLDNVLQTLLDDVLRTTHMEQGFAFLRGNDGEAHLAAARSQEGQDIGDDSAFSFSLSVVREAFKSPSEFLVTEANAPSALPKDQNTLAHARRFVLCIMLRNTAAQREPKHKTKSGPDMHGILYLDAPLAPGERPTVDEDILRGLARDATSLVENAALTRGHEILRTRGDSRKYVLVLVEGTDRRTLKLDHFPFTVGRKVDRDLVLADQRVSREHAQLLCESDGIYIVDLGSRHGTFVNGYRVNRQKLEENDRIEFGVQGASHVLFRLERPFSDIWRPTSGDGSDFEMLNVFLEAARKLDNTNELEDVLRTLLEASLRVTGAERGFVFLRGPANELRMAAGRNKNGKAIYHDSTVSELVLRVAATNPTEFLVTTSESQELLNRESGILKSVLCIPLRRTNIQGMSSEESQAGGSELLGIMYFDSNFVLNKLSSMSQDILRTMADSAASSMEKTFQAASEDATREALRRLRQELAIAAEIQQRLMTITVPDVPYAKVNALSYACKDVGGDFFDLVYTGNGLSLIVADVSGKGVGAAIVASILQGMLHSQLTRDLALPEMITAVNRFLCEKVAGQKYATLIVARLKSNGELELINCSLVPPLLISGDTITKVEESSLPVGLVPGAEFQVTRLLLKPGDRLLVVSDGVTEAEDAHGEFFGNERLEACCREGFAAIEQAVNDFRGETPLTDDCTITEMIYRG